MTKITIKRVYDEPKKGDGYRISVDCLWPRGLTKERAAVDAWRKRSSCKPCGSTASIPPQTYGLIQHLVY